MQIKSGDEFIPKNKQKAPKLNSDRVWSEEKRNEKQGLRHVAERGWRKAGH